MGMEMNEFLSRLVNYEKGLLKYQMGHFDPLRVGNMLRECGISYDGVRVFHVAGTKGKGSTALYLARLLQGAYGKVGLYTSPHLFRVEERIVVNGEAISCERLDLLVERWRGVIERFGCSFFEAMTFIAMVYFVEEGCEAIVLETGMGGRLDATNFVPNPAVAILTRIGWDHTRFLGDTLEAIAREKAGIIKEGVPVVSFPQEEGVRHVFEEVAREKNASIVFLDDGFSYRLLSAERQKWVYEVNGNGEYAQWETTQWGDVFVENFFLACLALKQAGISVSSEWKRAVFAKPLPFRIRYVDPFVLDVAHNPDSFQVLFRTLERIEGAKDFYVGILAEKELERILPLFKRYRGMFDHVVCFDFVSPRPSGGRILFHMWNDSSVEYLPKVPTIETQGKLSVVVGSFYWAEEFVRKNGISLSDVF